MRCTLMPWMRLCLVALLPVACTRDEREAPQAAAALCDEPAVRDVAARFGDVLQQVSLLAPDTLLTEQMRVHYGPLVTPALLDRWQRDPATAPGRETSSPWPERIAIDSVTQDTARACVVHGFVVYATSADAGAVAPLRAPVRMRVERDGAWRIAAYEQGELGAAAADGGRGAGTASEALRAPVTVRVEHDGEWRVAAYEQSELEAAAAGDGDAGVAGPADEAATDPAAAAAVVQRYYDAIAARDYADAYALWSGAGTASGQTRDEFAAGFAQTESVDVELGAPSHPEGAAGSVYVEVPVVVRARTFDGRAQRFAGTYTLRRSTVDGATPEQRAWHIHAARVRAVPPDSVTRDAAD